MRLARIILNVCALFFGLSLSVRAETPPKKIAGELPTYPSGALVGIQDVEVVLQMRVDERGKPKNIRVVDCRPANAPETFTRSALKAAKTWRFEPATKDGKPIEKEISQPFRFTLPPGAVVVVLECVIEANGDVGEARVVEDSAPDATKAEFQKVSLDICRRWRFRAGELRGKQRVPIVFVPNEPSRPPNQ